MKKISRPKKLSTEEFDAQYALSSAVVRGSSPEILEQLRLKLTVIQNRTSSSDASSSDA